MLVLAATPGGRNGDADLNKVLCQLAGKKLCQPSKPFLRKATWNFLLQKRTSKQRALQQCDSVQRGRYHDTGKKHLDTGK